MNIHHKVNHVTAQTYPMACKCEQMFQRINVQIFGTSVAEWLEPLT